MSFKNYKNNFPMDKLMELKNHFSDIFNLERLQNELEIIYNSPDKYLIPKNVFNYLYKSKNIKNNNVHFNLNYS